MKTRPDDLVQLPVFRSARPTDMARDLRTPQGDRLPKNLPFAVDNIWEWRRPPTCPSRRSAAFGSPRPELAAAAGPSDGQVCRVLVRPPFQVSQVIGAPDARTHPDVGRIVAIVERIRYQRPDLARALSVPLAEPKDVDAILHDLPESVSVELSTDVLIWHQTRCIDPAGLRVEAADLDRTGEIMFLAPLGYRLVPIGPPPSAPS